MSLTKAEREQGYRATPRPPIWADPILRRIAGGYLLLTMSEDREAFASYDNGEPIMVPGTENGTKRRRQMGAGMVRQWVKHGWLLPIGGETLFEDGPPQRYRARTIADGVLPRIIDPNGRPYSVLP